MDKKETIEVKANDAIEVQRIVFMQEKLIQTFGEERNNHYIIGAVIFREDGTIELQENHQANVIAVALDKDDNEIGSCDA